MVATATLKHPFGTQFICISQGISKSVAIFGCQPVVPVDTTYVFSYISVTSSVNFITFVPKRLPHNDKFFGFKRSSESLKLTEKEGKQKKILHIFPCAEITENSAKATFTMAEKTLIPISG